MDKSVQDNNEPPLGKLGKPWVGFEDNLAIAQGLHEAPESDAEPAAA